MHEGRVFNAAKYRHQTGTALVLIHFGVAEHVAFLHQFLDVADTPLVVRRQVVAVGKVERIYVVTARRVTVVNHF